MFLRKNLLLCFLAAVSVKGTAKLAEIPQVDHVIDSLSDRQWDEDETICRSKIFRILHNVKNSTLWATWIWDANPHAPLGTFYGARFHLGNYDQCLRPPWLSNHPELRTQYCLAEIEMSKEPAVKNWTLPGAYEKAEEYYVKSSGPIGHSFSFMSYGVCVPAGCHRKSVEKFVKALLGSQHLQAAWDAEVKIHHCDEAGVRQMPSLGYYAYMYTFAALAFMAIASTYYINEYPITACSDTFVNHVAKSFCLRRNWATVFKEEKDALPCMHGIKFLSATFVIFIHVTMSIQENSASNTLDFIQALETFITTMLVVHCDLVVDSFFAMSGLLLGKSLSTLDVAKPYNLLKNIARRYVRLLGPFAVTVFYMAHILMQDKHGPLYPKFITEEQQDCQQNWWLSLLMVGNYFNSNKLCVMASWYIPCDFHCYVMTLVLLYVYRKNPKIGKIATAIVVFLGFLGPAISVYVYNFPAVMLLNLRAESFVKRTKIIAMGYIKTHNRMGPYIAGLLVGYVMSLYKPADYKKIWSKTTSYLGVCAGLSLMVAVLATGVLCFQYHIYGLLACLYWLVDRTAFVVGVLCIIIFCTYGDVPLINSFLSWASFKPLSRLSYGVYVIHTMAIYIKKGATRNHVKFDGLDSIVECFGLLVVSLILSLIVWLLVEAPLVNFTNRYLDTRLESKEINNGNVNDTTKNREGRENITDKQKVM